MDRALQTTLLDLTKWLRREGISFAVIGGIAVIARGEARFTADIDIVVELELDAALQLVERLSSSPFRPLFPDVQEIVQKAFLLPISHVTTNVRVDVAVGLSGFEQQAIKRSTEVSLGGGLVPVVTAEDLILWDKALNSYKLLS